MPSKVYSKLLYLLVFFAYLCTRNKIRLYEIKETIDRNLWLPDECVFIATNGLFDFEFDLVVSGINSGANLGDDILYSGTVGAAFEGRLMHKPALAISLAGEHVKSYNSPEQYKIAAQWVHDFILKGTSCPDQLARGLEKVFIQ